MSEDMFLVKIASKGTSLNRRRLRYWIFIFSLSCSIVSATSYISENKATNLQNGDVHLFKFLTLKWNISRTILRIETGDSSLFCIFHDLSFELNLFSTGVFL